MKKFLPLLTLFFTSFNVLKAQNDTIPAWLITTSVTAQFPGADMADLFGTNFALGIGCGYKTASNWVFAANFQYMFGNNVPGGQDLISPITSEKGYIFNTTGNYATLNIMERGFSGIAEVSKTLNFLNINKYSGPAISLGAGYLVHWVRFQNVGNDAPQILDNYLKGYDHLTAGPALRQSLGYMYLSNNRRINFRLSFEIMEGFTKDLRGFDYSTGRPVSGQKFDLLYGIKLQWILPIYRKGFQTYYYN